MMLNIYNYNISSPHIGGWIFFKEENMKKKGNTNYESKRTEWLVKLYVSAPNCAQKPKL